jgi:hypothetical protein
VSRLKVALTAWAVIALQGAAVLAVSGMHIPSSEFAGSLLGVFIVSDIVGICVYCAKDQ